MLRRRIAAFLALWMLFLPLSSLGEVASPSDVTTPAPAQTESPSEEPSAAATPEMTPETSPTPTAEASASPETTPTSEPVLTATGGTASSPAPTATEEPWDESQCDHANARCVQAPACTAEGCAHIGTDVFGLDVPLCTLGQWLLDQEDVYLRDAQMRLYSVRARTLDLNTADVTLWRSGSYTVTGGDKREGATITVAKDRVVVLYLRGATVKTLTLLSDVDLTLQLGALSALETLDMREDASLTLASGGALSIQEVLRPASNDTTKIYVPGGSLDAVLTEASGRTLYRFDGQGATAVTVAGETHLADTPQEDGTYCLWLDAPASGMRWSAGLNGTILAVEQVATGGAETRTITQGTANTITKAGTYTLSGTVAAGTSLQIQCEDVQIVFSGATLPAGFTVASDKAYRLTLEEESVSSDAVNPIFTGMGEVTVSGSGSLRLQSSAALSVPLNAVGGLLTLASAPDGWQSFSVEGITAADQLTVDGAARGLVWNGIDTLYLPAPEAGYAYTVVRENGVIRALTAESGTKLFLLTSETPSADAGDAGTFAVRGSGSALNGSVTVSGLSSALAEFQDVQLSAASGAVLSLSDGKHLTVTLTGDNLLASGDAAIAMGQDVSLTLNCISGRLVLRGVSDLTGIKLLGNIRVEPEISGDYTHLLLKDKDGNPVADTDVTLRIGGEDCDFRTHTDGSIYLWGITGAAGDDVVATNGEEVYTAVIASGKTTVDTGLEIKDVSAKSFADGSVVITFSAPEAGSAGVQYLVGTAEQTLADCYVQAAQRADGLGTVSLTGLTAGQIVSFRVYATRTAGVTLTAENDDGFQFSDVYTHKHLTLYTAPSSANAVYTGEPYVCPFELPAGAVVTYSGDGLTEEGLPLEVGSYVMHVTLPETVDGYLPGTYDISFSITKKTLYIIPDPNQEKFCGEEDPVFTFTVRGLLDGDEVWGELTREEGEDVGNYEFRLDWLQSEDYYVLRLPGDAHCFTILPDDPGEAPAVVFYEMLHPVRQEITRKDGRTVAVVLNTQDSLTVTHSVIGNVVFATADDRFRPFSPILRYNSYTDEVLLQIRCEAELNDDGGYATDIEGNPLYEGRFFRMSYLGLRNLKRLGVDSVSVSQNGVQLMVRLEELLDNDMQETIRSLGGDASTARFKLELAAVKDLSEDAQAAVDDAGALTDGWQVSACLVLDCEEIPLEGYLETLTVTVDAESTADLLESMNLYDEAAFADFLSLSGIPQTGTEAVVLESDFVTPFRSDELKLAEYPQVMFTHRYLAARMTEPMTVFLTRKD